MEKPVLILDYSVDGQSGGLIGSWLKQPYTILKITEGDMFPSVNAAEYRAAIHSGSSHSILADTSFINGAITFVLEASDAAVPQMGICYGHQLLARAFLGKSAVARCSSIEVGWRDVDFLSQWPDEELSGTMSVWQSHYDCVKEIPENSLITASNSHTGIQAFINRDLKLMGTQFHPEFDRVRGNECFAKDEELFKKNGVDLKKTLASGPGFNTGVIFTHFLKTFEQE